MHMIDYEELYYASQKKLTETIQILEQEAEKLKTFQCLCEDRVLRSCLKFTRREDMSDDSFE